MKTAKSPKAPLNRRSFLGRLGTLAGSAVALPQFIPARALGRDGADGFAPAFVAAIGARHRA